MDQTKHFGVWQQIQYLCLSLMPKLLSINAATIADDDDALASGRAMSATIGCRWSRILVAVASI